MNSSSPRVNILGRIIPEWSELTLLLRIILLIPIELLLSVDASTMENCQRLDTSQQNWRIRFPQKVARLLQENTHPLKERFGNFASRNQRLF